MAAHDYKELKDGDTRQKKILTVILCLHAISFAMLFPVYPSLTLYFSHGDTRSAAGTMGWIAAMVALLKLVMNPVFGSLSDSYGRKNLFCLGLAMHCINWLLLALFPSFSVLILTKFLIAVTDSVYVLAYAILVDLTLEGDKTSHSFGLIGVAFGVGLVLGPISGGFLMANDDLNVTPLYVASFISFIALSLAVIYLEETKTRLITRFKLLWSKPILSLACLLFFIHGSSGIHTIWFLYTNYRFGWKSSQNGLFLSFFGLCIIFVQGVLLRIVVPKYLSDWNAVLFGLGCKAIGFLAIVFASQGWMLYGIAILTAFDGLATPSLQSIATTYVSKDEQGALQGILGSITTIAMMIFSLVFAQVFQWSILHDLPELAYWIDGSLLLVVACVLATIFHAPI